MGVDFRELRREVRDAAERAFTELRRAHPDEQFYAFALYTDPGLMTVMPAANSEEAYQDAAEDLGEEDASQLPFYRWAPGEWAYEAAGEEHFTTACRMLNQKGRFDPNDAEEVDRFGNGVISAMVGALQDLDAAGFFGTGKEREAVTLFVTLSDSDGAPELETATARQLNPPDVAERFAARYA